MYNFISNSTWFDKKKQKTKSVFMNFSKLAGKKWLNFVQVTNIFYRLTIFTDIFFLNDKV